MTKKSLRLKPSVFLAALLLLITGLLALAQPADAEHFEIPATVGEPVQYGFGVSNAGDSYDVAASFTIEYPASFTGAGGEITQGTGTCTTIGNTVTCEFVTPPGQTYGSVTFATPTEAGVFTAPYTYVLITPRGTDTIEGHVAFRVLPAQEPAPQPEPQPQPESQPQPVAQPPSGSQNATVTVTGNGNEVSVDQSIEQNAFSPTVSAECLQQAPGTQRCPGAVGYGDENSATQQVE